MSDFTQLAIVLNDSPADPVDRQGRGPFSASPFNSFRIDC